MQTFQVKMQQFRICMQHNFVAAKVFVAGLNGKLTFGNLIKHSLRDKLWRTEFFQP